VGWAYYSPAFSNLLSLPLHPLRSKINKHRKMNTALADLADRCVKYAGNMEPFNHVLFETPIWSG
jgi:hypothetical protein